MFARGEKYKGQEGVFIGQKPKDSEGIERSLLIMFEMKGGDEIVNGAYVGMLGDKKYTRYNGIRECELSRVAFMEANYEVLKSLLRDYRRKVRNEDLHTELDSYNEEYDEERERDRAETEFEDASNMDGSRVEREFDDRRPPEQRVEDGESRGVNLPPLLATHLGRSKNGQPLQLTLTFGYGCNKPSTNAGGYLLPNGMHLSHNAPPFIPNSLQLSSNGHMPICVNPYSQPNTSMTYGQPSGYSFHTQVGNPSFEGASANHPHRGYTQQAPMSNYGPSYQGPMYPLNVPPTRYPFYAQPVNPLPNAPMYPNYGPTGLFANSTGRDNSKGKKKNRDRFSPYKGSNHGFLSNLSKSPWEILATEKAEKAFEQPPHMVGSRRSRGNVPAEAPILMVSRGNPVPKRKSMRELVAGTREITFPPVLGSCEVIDEHFFLKLKSSIRELYIDSKIPLVGFSGNILGLSERLWSINMKLNLKKCLLASKRVPRQVPIYFMSRVLQGVELNYPKLEKLIFALVYVERRLQRYFQAYPIRVLTDKPIKQILARPKKLGRIAKWAIKLDEHDIKFKGHGSVKGEILYDFLDEVPSVKDRDTEIKKLEVENKLIEIILFIVDSGHSKHMTRNLKLLTNFVEKFLETAWFDNDQFTPILGYGDLTHFLRSKEEPPEVLINFLRMIQKGLQALNAVVKRRNRTLIEAAQTTLNATKHPLFFWAEAIATACFIQNRSLKIPRHKMTPYHIINKRKPNLKILHVFGCTYYIVRDGENLDKMKEKGDACIFVGYSTQSRGYRVYNKRTRMIDETIHVNFDELQEMMFEQDSSSLAPQHTTNTKSLSELELLFSPMFDEYFKGENEVVSKPSVVSDKSNTTQSTITPVDSNAPPLIIQTTTNPTTPTSQVYVKEDNTIQSDDAQFDPCEFINAFATPVTDISKSSSSRTSMWYSFKASSDRRHIATGSEICMFALTVSKIEPKTIEEAMADHA
ncbi:retrovirus-related pol polyprotein from transposon TNT 1-94 [Tanacetum coccineum]